MGHKLDQYKKRLLALQDIYEKWRLFHRDVTRYLLPRRGMYLDDGSPNQQNMNTRQQYTLDDTGTRAIRTLGAGMQGGLSSPSRPWFKYGLHDTDLSEFGPVKDWLAVAEKVAYQIFARSNYYTVAHACYEEQGGFGTSVVFFEESIRDIIRFKLFTAGEYRLALGADGKVDTMYFPFYMSAQQLVEMFGMDKVSHSVRTAMNTNPYKDFEVVHAVEPRKDRDRSKVDNRNMPYASVWYESTAPSEFLRESGYKNFPAAVPRWSALSNIPYGLGPGHDALGAVKMLQEMQKTGLKGLHKMVDPPMRTNPSFKGVLDLTPGANNPLEKDAVDALYKMNLPLAELEAKIAAIQGQVEKTFYNDMFLMLSALDTGRDVTAREVAERHEEKLLMLGPTIERQENEFLSPSVNKVFELSVERGMLPPPPEEIQGKEIKIEYISILAQAQKLVAAQSIHAYVGMAERIAAVAPSSLDKTDFDALMESYADIVGAPPAVVRSDEETDDLRQRRALAEQEAAKAEQALQASQAAKNLGDASTKEGTALAELTKAVRK